MKKRIESVLHKAIHKSVDFIYAANNKLIREEPISYSARRSLNEILESLYQISSLGVLRAQEDAIIKKVFNVGERIILEKLIYFGNYYYSKQILIHEDISKKEVVLTKTNVESASMLIRIRSFQLGLDAIGNSTDDYFISRMPQLLDGISFVIDKNINEVFLPVLYNLLNIHQTIFYYLQSNHKKYLPELDTPLNRINDLILKLDNKAGINNLCEGNLSLKLFYEQYLFFNSSMLASEYNPSIIINGGISNLSSQQSLRILANLSVLDNSKFLQNFEEVLTLLEKKYSIQAVDAALFIKCAAKYLLLTDQIPAEVTIDLKLDKIDISKYLPTYFKGIEKMGNITINDSETALLHSYDDATLRSKLAACIYNIPTNEIEREMRKPHGVFEISDMELKIKIDGNITYLCMPFKTGREIKSNSVPVEIIYQLLRPFYHFSHCAVVFITAKSCSQNLLNEIKRGQDKYSHSIEVIENQQLAKLLKINGQLN